MSPRLSCHFAASSVIFTGMLSVAIFLVRGYRGSFAAKGARNREW
jgi:hypothetical protein